LIGLLNKLIFGGFMNVAVVGAGVIGRGIVKSLLINGNVKEITATKRNVDEITVLEKFGVTVTKDNKVAAKGADIVFLCVKPKDVKYVLKEIENEIFNKIVISMAAVLSLDYLKSFAPEAKFVRAMPNLAILVNESFTCYCVDSDLSKNEIVSVEKLLKTFGIVKRINEKQMDAITALSGCAPAYLSLVLDALVCAGLEVGLPRTLALNAIAQSMIGTGKLVLEAKKTPLEIKDMVTTPDGVTMEGLKELEKAQLRLYVKKAIQATTSKSKKILKLIQKKPKIE
jgi:pyrroline-5-carboxylate reductase